MWRPTALAESQGVSKWQWPADEVYGDNGPLRSWLENSQIRYVLAVSRDHQVPAGAGLAIRADQVAARLPRKAWQQLSAGAGAKGHRYYDWAFLAISDSRPGYRWLLIRRNQRTRELAFYQCYAPRQVPLAVLVKTAGRRWTTEENFQAGKGLTGLDEHQVRRWTFLVPVGHPGHACRRRPHHHCGHRTRPQPGTGRPVPVDPQRDRPPARHRDQPPARRPAPDALVPLAPPPPAPRPHLSLPAAIHAAVKITIYGWSTSEAPPLTAESCG